MPIDLAAAVARIEAAADRCVPPKSADLRTLLRAYRDAVDQVEGAFREGYLEGALCAPFEDVAEVAACVDEAWPHSKAYAAARGDTDTEREG